MALTGTDSRVRATILDLLEPGRIEPAFQPIVRLDDGVTVGFEALARVAGDPTWGPLEFLAEASQLGCRPALERACLEAIAAAYEAGTGLPGDALLFVNISPDVLLGDALEVVRPRLPRRLVVELTEQAAVDDYELLRARMQGWSGEGIRLAIDDTGAGYSSLRHVLELSPEFLKLDRSLVHGVDHDRKLQALVHSLVAFAGEVGATVVAEGVERVAELGVLRAAGVHLAQGFLFGRPAALPAPARVPAPAPSPSGQAPATAPGAPLAGALAVARSARDACTVTCDHLRRLGELLPSVYLVRNGLLRCQAQRGYWQVMDGFPPEVGLLGRAVRTGERLAFGDIGCESDYVEAAPGLAAEIVIPLRVAGRVVGALNVESASPIPASVERAVDEAAALLEVELARLGVDDGDAALARLARCSMRLAGVVDEDELRELVVATACEVGRTSSGMVAERTPTGELVVTGTCGPLGPALAAIAAHDVELLAAAVERVTSCYTANDPTGRTPLGSERLRAEGVRFIAVLPLISRGRRHGILVVADDRELVVDTDDVEALELLATEAGRCIELAATVAELRDRASTDPLTSLGNHSSFYEALSRLGSVDEACLLLLDIDGFKPVNDTHGHLTGDRVLRDLAAALRSSLRPGDRLYRIGGDEFAVILPDGSLAAGLAVGRALRYAAGPVLDPYGAGISVGAAAGRPGEPVAAWVERADRALYGAKRTRAGVQVAVG
jgi:diguanylate cyclase (GGDEF)-like protein